MVIENETLYNSSRHRVGGPERQQADEAHQIMFKKKKKTSSEKAFENVDGGYEEKRGFDYLASS